MGATQILSMASLTVLSASYLIFLYPFGRFFLNIVVVPIVLIISVVFWVEMASKKKKSHWSLRATAAVARGLGKGSWWVIKNVSKGAYHGGALAYNKLKHKKAERELRKQPHYSSPAVFQEFGVVSTVAGDYASAGKKLFDSSLIVLVFGKRGSGKSALGFRIMENIYSKTERKCFVLGVPQRVLPAWITSVDDLEQVANGGIVLVDEGAIAFGSRESMKSVNRAVGKLMAIARHKDLTLVFITQNTGMLDKSVLNLADVLMIKEGSLLQQEMERAEIKKFYQKAHGSFASLPKQREPYFYVVDADFEGMLSASLPSFWSSAVSKSRSAEKE